MRSNTSLAECLRSSREATHDLPPVVRPICLYGLTATRYLVSLESEAWKDSSSVVHGIDPGGDDDEFALYARYEEWSRLERNRSKIEPQ